MALAQLIYASRATASFNRAELDSITTTSSAANLERHVTGTLLYACGYFVQILEGEEAIVKALFRKISLDPRHVDVRQLYLSPLDRRAFPKWGMSALHGDDHMNTDPVRLGNFLASISQGENSDQMGAKAKQLLVDLHRAAFGDIAEAA